MSARFSLADVAKMPLKNQREVVDAMKSTKADGDLACQSPTTEHLGQKQREPRSVAQKGPAVDLPEIEPKTRPKPKTSRAEFIATVVLQNAAGLWYVSANDTQRNRAVKTAADLLEPFLREIELAAERRTAQNPS